MPVDYNLPGPQVEPAAAYWAKLCNLHTLEMPVIKGLAVAAYPTQAADIDAEIAFLNVLASPSNRRKPDLLNPAELALLTGSPAAAGLNVRPLSLFLSSELRPYQTPDAAYDTSLGASANVVNDGMELARYFRAETPGLAHRLAVTYLFDKVAKTDPASVWSPPRQALVWAALDTAISSALMAAWYVKWLSPGPGVGRRQRPVEHTSPTGGPVLNDVLYDYSFPPHQPNQDPSPSQLFAGPSPSPGTPRHPAYTSGHSTYSAAASTVLAHFFPAHEQDFRDLADNIGMARLWGGVHWPSDHRAGANLGRRVGEVIVHQIRQVPKVPDMRTPIPTVPQLEAEAGSA